jgi:hypothetical protein
MKEVHNFVTHTGTVEEAMEGILRTVDDLAANNPQVEMLIRRHRRQNPL